MSRGRRLQLTATERLGFLALVLVAFALRLWRLDVQDIWWDEARNIDVALRPLAAIPGAPELDIHPPGYFILLHVWLRLAGVHPFTTRFFSVWFGVLLVPLVVALSRRLGWRSAAWGAACYAAVAPFLVSEAQETRMYTLAFALIAFAAWWFWRVWQGHRRAWIGLGLCLAAAVGVHYGTAFVLVSWYAFAALVFLSRALCGDNAAARRTTIDLSRAVGLALLLFLPQVPRALQQVTPYRNPNLHVPDLGTYLVTLWHAYTVGLPAEGRWTWYAQLFFAGLLGVGILAGGLQRGRRLAVAYVLASLLLPVTLYYVVLIDRATFAPRYISFVLPFLALALGGAFGWRPLRPWGARVLAAAVLLALGAGVYADQYNPAYYREDTSGLARWLEQTTGPDDVILIDVPYPLGFYYPRFSRTPDQPPPPEPASSAPAYYLFVDVHTVAERLNALVPGKRRVFWVQWYKSDTDPRGVVRYLLGKYGVQVAEKAFQGYQVYVYRVPPTVHFQVADTWEPVHVQFADGVALTAISAGQAPELEALPEAGNRPVWVAIRWQRHGAPKQAYKVSVRLWDPAGHQIAQDDRRILNDRHLGLPFWAEKEEAMNVYLLELPAGTPPGDYTVTARVYDPESGQPVSVLSARQVREGVDAVVAQVRVRRPRRFPDVRARTLAEAPLGIVETRLGFRRVAPGTVLPVEIVWRAQRAIPADIRVRLALSAEEGHDSLWETEPVPWYPTEQWQPGEVVRSILDWRLGPEVPEGEYTALLYEVDPTGQEWGPVVLGTVHVAGRPRHFSPPPVAYALNPAPQFDNLARLIGYSVEGAWGPGQTVKVTLVWRALRTADVSYTGFVQILNPQNRVVAQEDHIPQRGAAPTTSWVAGEYVEDRYELHLPDALPPGTYRLIAGLYDARDMRRLPVLNAEGNVIGDHVELHPDVAALLSGR